MTTSNGTPAPGSGTDTGRSGTSSGPAARARPSGADRARDEMIADIDGRLRHHERTAAARLDQLDSTVRDSAGLLAETLPRLDALGQAIAELTGRVDTLAGRATDTAPMTPVCWPALTADAAEKEWNLLADWVGAILGPWYHIRRRQVPDCWALHRPVMLQLSWLHRTWLAAHTGPAATPTAAAEWHARWLPAALDAIRAEAPDYLPNSRHSGEVWANLCRPGHHHDPIPATVTFHRDSDDDQYRPPLPHEIRDHTRPPLRVEVHNDPIDRRHWHHFWAQAVTDDLAWRRARDVAVPIS